MANFNNLFICPILKLLIAPSHNDIPPTTNLSSDGKFSQRLFICQLCSITNKWGKTKKQKRQPELFWAEPDIKFTYIVKANSFAFFSQPPQKTIKPTVFVFTELYFYCGFWVAKNKTFLRSLNSAHPVTLPPSRHVTSYIMRGDAVPCCSGQNLTVLPTDF